MSTLQGYGVVIYKIKRIREPQFTTKDDQEYIDKIWVRKYFQDDSQPNSLETQVQDRIMFDHGEPDSEVIKKVFESNSPPAESAI